MKKNFALLFFSFLLLASSGYALQNRLTINTASNATITVMIDGRNYPVNNSTNGIEITDMRTGTHNLKLYRQSNKNRGWQRNSNSGMELLYNANLNIRQGYDVDITINRFGKVFTDVAVLNSYSNNGYGNNRNDRDKGYDDENNRYPQNGNYNGNNNYRQPMDFRSYAQMQQVIARQSFDREKMQAARAATGNNYLSTEQVKGLLNLFSFEDNKLEMAKYWYRFSSDPQTYYVLTDVFTFSKNKQELLRFIQQNK